MAISLGFQDSKERDDEGNSQVVLLPFLLIIERQAQNAFECLTRYQSYQAWMVFRPVIEATLIIGKFIDDPNNADLWRNKKIYYRNKEKENIKRYRDQFEVDGLIPQSLLYGKEIRRLLSKINDDFMHVNYEYFNDACKLEDKDDRSCFFRIDYCDNDRLKHRAHLYSFLNIYQLLTISLGEALFCKYTKHPFLKNFDEPSIKIFLSKKVYELFSDNEELNMILNEFGLWGVR